MTDAIKNNSQGITKTISETYIKKNQVISDLSKKFYN